MEKEPRQITQETTSDKGIKEFQRFYPEGKLRVIDLRSIPQDIMRKFENNSSKFISPKDFLPYNFTGAYLLELPGGDEVYITEQTKIYDTSGTTELLTYFIEMRGNEEIGHGELRKDISKNPIFNGEPFVGFTKTEELHIRQRLGERRLDIMNAFAQMRFGQPLYSGDTISDDARAMFEKLTTEGKVEIVEEKTRGGIRRSYRMKKIEIEQN